MRHLYVHVPFCRRRCSYCDFSIAVRRVVPSARFANQVKSEWAIRAAAGEYTPETLDTLYFGGGTPSLLPSDCLADLIGWARREIGLAPDAEVTLEANPDDVTAGGVAAWRAAGITRVSLGVQSLEPATLAWMHRTHDPDAARRAMRRIGQGGFDSWSVDVIFALDTESGRGQGATVDQILSAEPPHVSAYGLTVERATPLGKWVARGLIAPVPAGRYADDFLAVRHTLTSAGFRHYEVSNYAQPGHRSRHNTAYWSGAAYVGLGPSAHSFDGTRRRWNLNAWAAYDRCLDQRVDPVEGREDLTARQRELEAVYLGLRTDRGIPAAGVPDQRALERAIASGWLRPCDGRMVATAEGWLRLDELVGRLTTSA